MDLLGCDAVTGGRPGARASRPHNTGTASPLSSTQLDRQRRHDSASVEPMGFPPAGWPGAASRGNRAATQPRECGRDARAPGGAPPPILRKYPFDIGCHTPRSTTHRSIHWCSFVSIGGSPFPVVDISFPFVSFFVSLRCPSCDFVALSFFCFRQAPPLPCRADHPRVKHPIVNKGEPRMNTNGHEYRWTCLAATPSWDEVPPGSAGVPPAQHWHSLTPLFHPARPATAPRFRFSRAHGVPGGRVARRRITGKLSGHPTQRMRARRPRSRWGASSHPSCSARRHRPCRCGRAVPLRRPSCVFVDPSFFRMFQTRRATSPTTLSFSSLRWP